MSTRPTSGRGAVLRGWGAYAPSRVVTNADLEAILDTSDEWIRTRTGITERRWASADESTGDLAVEAARAALVSSGAWAADRVILATTTPDHPCPATAPWVAHRLGLGNVPAYDLSAVCSGFLYGLAAAREAILAGSADRVLLIGADTFTKIVDPQDRNTAVIFGDGAGAVVLEAGAPEGDGRLGDVLLAADGSQTDLIQIRSGGARHRVAEGDPGRYFSMRGKEVFQAAVEGMSHMALAAMARAGWEQGSCDWLVAHQANRRILSAIARALGIPDERIVVDLERYGNTSAASVPMALTHHAHRFAPGDRIVLASFGGGTTWGATTLLWPSDRHPQTLTSTGDLHVHDRHPALA